MLIIILIEFQNIHNTGQAQLFRNPYLEFMTKAHPLVIWGMYLPVLILFPYYSVNTLDFSGLQALFIFIGGVFFWSLTEYILHRFAFHHHPTSERGKRIHYVLHGNHHEYPRDKERLFMPAAPSLIIASAFFFVFYLLMELVLFCFVEQ